MPYEDTRFLSHLLLCFFRGSHTEIGDSKSLLAYARNVCSYLCMSYKVNCHYSLLISSPNTLTTFMLKITFCRLVLLA